MKAIDISQNTWNMYQLHKYLIDAQNTKYSSHVVSSVFGVYVWIQCYSESTSNSILDTSRLIQKARQFHDDIFKCIFLNGNM